MKALRKSVDKLKVHFDKGGKLEKLHYVFDGFETFLFAPNTITKSKGVQVRDAVDMKRLMNTVIISMLPCLLFGIWNVGHQHSLYSGEELALIDKVLIGLKVSLPIIIVSYGVGLGIEFLFTTMKKEPISEGFLVSGMLIPLVMPPTIPLWQVALATAFAVVIGKEAFGGTGFNVLNVALTARAFLYFAYPSQISGEVWTYIGYAAAVDGYTGATFLGFAAETVESGQAVVTRVAEATSGWAGATDIFSFNNLFVGAVPGSIGETSTLACLIGAVILIGTGVGSWKIILSVFAGAFLMGLGFNAVAVEGNGFMAMAPQFHLVIGGLAFGAVYMATDPVTAAHTETGKWIYGLLIGALTVIIRVVNPAYPEGIMLAILLMNVFAPLIDFYVVNANKKRRLKRVAAV